MVSSLLPDEDAKQQEVICLSLPWAVPSSQGLATRTPLKGEVSSEGVSQELASNAGVRVSTDVGGCSSVPGFRPSACEGLFCRP